MENAKPKNTVTKPHSIEIQNRSKSTVTGVEKVISSCDNALLLATSCGGLSIQGSNFKISKFSVEEGTLCFEGEVNALKYSAAKVPLLKRIFK